MKPSTELFDLVKSLSKSEKRFFKLSSSLQSGDKNYLKVFDAIEKQKVYDEEALKNAFSGETFIKHFPSEKNHLYKLILKSLRAYHSDNSISSVLKQEIKNIEILYKKALYKECNKFLVRAKKLAIGNEKFYYLFELISWEKMLLEEAYEAGNFDKDLDALIQEEADCITKLRNLAEYQILYSQMNYAFRSVGFARNAEERRMVEEISQNHLIKGKDTALSVRATTICFYIKGICASFKRDFSEAYRCFSRVREIFDENPKIRKDLSKRYILTLSHLLYCYIDSKAYDEVFELIRRLRALSKEPGFNGLATKVRLFTASYTAELLAYRRMGEYEKGIALVPEIVQNMELMKDKINKEQEIVFYYNIAYLHFGQGEYNKSLFWINKVLNDNEQELRQDIYSFARLFNLVIHYELGNYDLLEYIIKSTKRYLDKREKDYFIEDTVIAFFKKLAKNSDEEKTRKTLEQMQEQTENLFQNREERVVLDYFNFRAWITSKLTGTSFAEAVKGA